MVAVAIAGWLCLVSAAEAQTVDGTTNFTGLAPSHSAATDPVPVRAGIFLTQITDVDQKSENFTVVARLRLDWSDPDLAFDPDVEGTDRRVMSTPDFIAYARAQNIRIPTASFENLQARSFTKQSAVSWTSAGDAFHVSETVLTLQAPDFDFRKHPFDTQKFYVRLLLNRSTDAFVFEDLEGFSGLGPALGEEEWIIRRHWTEVDTTRGIAGWDSSRISLVFEADRHLIYYWTRILIPLLLLTTISWANLFLEEYRRRIDIAGANLLAFIAFNFAVSGDLPRLGYVTFLDALMLAMFITSAVTVAYNVMLRRLSVTGHEGDAKRIDWHVTFWGFPLIHMLIILSLWRVFFG
ncbi:hypothetical protein [Tropicimonas sp. S265A]|uniref:hypothetical protein n=1 Tax=Tropicimonas sp. S265A TaxID=3415134 RepID=UPI003C7AD339